MSTLILLVAVFIMIPLLIGAAIHQGTRFDEDQR